MNHILQQLALSKSLHFDRDLLQYRNDLVYQNNINISCFEGLLFSFSETLEILEKARGSTIFYLFVPNESYPFKVCEKEQETLVHIKFCWRTRWKILNNRKVTITVVISLRFLCQVAETLCHTDAALYAGIILAWCPSFIPEVLSKTVWKLGYGFMWSDSCQNLVSAHRQKDGVNKPFW